MAVDHTGVHEYIRIRNVQIHGIYTKFSIYFKKLLLVPIVIRVDSMSYLVVLNTSVLVVPLQHSVLLPVSDTTLLLLTFDEIEISSKLHCTASA